MNSKAPSPRSRPSSYMGTVASRASQSTPSPDAGMAGRSPPGLPDVGTVPAAAAAPPVVADPPACGAALMPGPPAVVLTRGAFTGYRAGARAARAVQSLRAGIRGLRLQSRRLRRAGRERSRLLGRPLLLDGGRRLVRLRRSRRSRPAGAPEGKVAPRPASRAGR